MPKNKQPVFDNDNPEWTEADFANAKNPEDVLPAEVLTAFPQTMKHLGRSPESKKKSPVYIRLSPDVVEHFRAKGRNWQIKIDEVLKQWVVLHPQ